jgi:pyruvate dehydrogenase E2 component (dihydrolipoamide acetyltransferase)
MGEFRMPSMGADMEAATLVEWKVEPGDRVRHGDIIAEIETEKGDIDVEVFEDGVVEDLLVAPGEKLPVGALLARIREEGEDIPADAAPAGGNGAESPHADEPELTVARPQEPPPTPPPRRHVRASPLARRVAADLGVDLSEVTGSGPQGAIQRADVERAAQTQAPPETPTPPEEQPPEEPSTEEAPTEETPVEEAPAPEAQAPYPERMRQAIAKAMARSNREIPHYFLETPISMQRALQWLEAENEERSVQERLLPVALLLRAVIRALDDVPALNGYWRNDRHDPQEAIHLGVAISLRQGGLVIPAIRNADQKTVDELMQALDDLITRARSGRLRSSELTEATITVTNLGDLGVETVHGMIYPPQVALVGFGKITEHPWAEDGMLGVRPVVTATLAGDHRATDGRQGAKFLDAINKHLQHPDEL